MSVVSLTNYTTTVAENTKQKAFEKNKNGRKICTELLKPTEYRVLCENINYSVISRFKFPVLLHQCCIRKIASDKSIPYCA